MRDPHPGARPHDGLEGGDEAARRVHHDEAAVARLLVDVGLAVGDDDDALPVQVPAQRVLESLRRPEAPLALRLALGREPLDEVADVPQERSELGARHLPAHEPAHLVAPPAPGQARRSQGDDRRRQGQEAEGEPEEGPGRLLAPLDEAQVVHEHHEPEGLPCLSEERDRGGVHVAAGHREDRRPGRPARVRRLRRGADAGPDRRAPEGRRVVGGPRLEAEVGAAGGRAEDALVVSQFDEDLPQLRLLPGRPAGHERLARATDGEVRAQLHVLLEPGAGRAADERRRTPREQGQAHDESHREPEGLPHPVSFNHAEQSAHKGFRACSCVDGACLARRRHGIGRRRGSGANME